MICSFKIVCGIYQLVLIISQMGMIVDRNKSECRATVQLQQTKELLTVDYDDICEYVGDSDVI